MRPREISHHWEPFEQQGASSCSGSGSSGRSGSGTTERKTDGTGHAADVAAASEVDGGEAEVEEGAGRLGELEVWVGGDVLG